MNEISEYRSMLRFYYNIAKITMFVTQFFLQSFIFFISNICLSYTIFPNYFMHYWILFKKYIMSFYLYIKLVKPQIQIFSLEIFDSLFNVKLIYYFILPQY